MLFVNLIVILYSLQDVTGQFGRPLNKYIDHYEGVSYDTETLRSSHQRAKRALSSQDKTLQLDFHAYGRYFNLRMKRDTSIFSPDLIIDMSGEQTPIDTSHIYSGEIFGEKGTLTHGSVIGGRFEGFIKTHQGTYYVEPTERYIKDKDVPFHSVIYHENDINYPHKYGAEGGCADHAVFKKMRKFQESGMKELAKEVNSVLDEEISHSPVILRSRRATSKEKNTCQLFIQTDHLFFKYYGSREAVIAQISSHVKAVDSIFRATDFMGIRNISFMVKRIRINTTKDEKDRTNPFRFANIGVEKFLELNSEQNHDDYCLAYVFTDRDFDNGVVGLAWLGDSSGAGSICAKSTPYIDGEMLSVNTGVITVRNYAFHMPSKISHIVFAHEIGHNFGSPHDSGIECIPGRSSEQSKKEQGNYIMYASATSGDKFNNNRFSPCSIRNISAVLQRKKDDCFVEPGRPICGNGLVEAGEQCDCGYSDECEDICCYSANEEEGKKCQLQPGKLCSPSQGPCCTSECSFKGTNERCRLESECAMEGRCNGATALCPASEPKKNLTSCHSETQVCISGVCSGSICDKYNLEVCTCTSNDDGKDEAAELCYVCCMEKMNPATCSSSGSDKWARYFNKTVIILQPGSPCNDFKGYCDVFMKCRLADTDGPLARLLKSIFDLEFYENITEWIVAHWWLMLLMGFFFIILMAGFIKVCSVHTPSNNPRLLPPKPLPGRRRQQQRQHYQEDYEMGHMRP